MDVLSGVAAERHRGGSGAGGGVMDGGEIGGETREGGGRKAWRMRFGQRSRARAESEGVAPVRSPGLGEVVEAGEREKEQDGDELMQVDTAVPAELSSTSNETVIPQGLGGLGMGGTSRFHVLARVSIADRSVWLPLGESFLGFLALLVGIRSLDLCVIAYVGCCGFCLIAYIQVSELV